MRKIILLILAVSAQVLGWQPADMDAPVVPNPCYNMELIARCAADQAAAQPRDTRWYSANPAGSVFTISSAEELAGLAAIVNGTWGGKPAKDDFSGKIVRLAADIDLSGYNSWIPIGNYSCYQVASRVFSGVFDGGGHTITNLTISRPEANFQGLFGYIKGGWVVNLGLDAVSVFGADDVGAVAGYLDNSSVDNCYSIGVVGAFNSAGGIVGGTRAHRSISSITNCWFAGAVGSSGNNYLFTPPRKFGGIAGVTFYGMKITDCAALNILIYGDKGTKTGRVAGYVDNARNTLSNNAAWAAMINSGINTEWVNKGADKLDGADITTDDIKADGTLGGRFTEENGWTTEDGKLPGLGGKTVEIPAYITNADSMAASIAKALQVIEAAAAAAAVLPDCYAETESAATATAIDTAPSGKTKKVAKARNINTRWYAANPGAATFTISTAKELAGLAAIVNGIWGGTPARDDFSGKTVKLGKNINLSRYKNWEPIGNFSADTNNIFSGTFDGGGKTISNLTIKRFEEEDFEDVQGLFGIVADGKVKNLGLDRIKISGSENIGGVAGFLSSSGIVNCWVAGGINGSDGIGGIAGSLDNSSIVNSYSAVKVHGFAYIGGVAGYIGGGSSITGSYSTGRVSGTTNIGGVAGAVTDCSIVANSYSTGAIGGGSGDFGGCTGGVAGLADNNGSVTNCAALNRSVRGGDEGRIAGCIDENALLNNIARTKMKNEAGSTAWPDKGANAKDGADITAKEIKADGTLGGRFTVKDGWTTQNGKLPGLRGRAAEMPKHLR